MMTLREAKRAKCTRLSILGSSSVCGCNLAMSLQPLGDTGRIQLVFSRKKLESSGLVRRNLFWRCEEVKDAGVSKTGETSPLLYLFAHQGCVVLGSLPFCFLKSAGSAARRFARSPLEQAF